MKRPVWRSIPQRAQGQRIVDLRYDADTGYLVLELEEGEVWVSADWEGCDVILI